MTGDGPITWSKLVTVLVTINGGAVATILSVNSMQLNEHAKAPHATGVARVEYEKDVNNIERALQRLEVSATHREQLLRRIEGLIEKRNPLPIAIPKKTSTAVSSK